ncbi:hypothetical protein NQT62_10605 [Limnobacter humi]|uniref:OmpA-like domain-containing protein n=1 Tax=Limnobacter humi TaxID=1778671 RepID=A0ABT1WH79_9BURK|nr:hypothetical protein [Limnobacter humi]MCQ8896880.1 hypothetical protein [Limnobacter humi]
MNRYAVWTIGIMLLMWGLLGISTTALPSQPALETLKNPDLHCGESYELDPYEGLMGALANQGSNASDLKLRRGNRQLALVIHFAAGSATVPSNCMTALNTLSNKVKAARGSKLLIRSATKTDTSSEMDLAIADARLDQLKEYFREQRVARKALILELHPRPSSALIENSVEVPRVVEIYFSQINGS